MSVRWPVAIAAVWLLAALAGCAAVGPDYRRPDAPTPATFKEADGWKLAQPQAVAGDGRWWSVYGDTLLDSLVAQVEVSNQNVVAAEAQYRQALALLGAARAPRLPTVSAAASAAIGRNASAAAISSVNASAPINKTYRESLSLGWEADVWGRIRRAIEASEAAAQASEADLQAALLSAQATLVQSYLQLRVIESQRQLLDDTTMAYERSLQITRNRYEAGVAARSDVSQAQTQLLSARSQAIDLQVTRAQTEHAIAALIGRPPSALQIPVTAVVPAPPALPLSLPSELLERRPDIAGAERRVAAANAQIGVAQAAFFPTISLGGTFGITSSVISNLASLPYRYWSIGPSLAATLFDNGLRSAQKESAVAAWERTVAIYRQTVLTAFQDVEDNLVALRVLEQEDLVQREVVRSAGEALEQVNNQYLAGTVSFLNVITAQATLLNARSTLLGISGRRLSAAVGLQRALGGDWRVNRTLRGDRQDLQPDARRD